MKKTAQSLLELGPRGVTWLPVHQVKAEQVYGSWEVPVRFVGAQLQQCCGWRKLLPAAVGAAVGQWRLPGCLQAALVMVQAAERNLHGTGQMQSVTC